MRVRSRQYLLGALSLLALIPSIVAVPPPADAADAKEIDSTFKAGSKSSPVGTEHAPIDGKDGIPKQGPWVETNAERERKKAKTDLDDDDDDHDTRASPAELKKYKGSSGQRIPQSNDGVMDDKSRTGPVEGTRGTEGGISEKSKSKSKDTTASDSRIPDSPKGKPPLPHSEKEKLESPDEIEEESAKAVLDEESPKLLEKPKDLPEKPHGKPMPENPSSPKDSTLDSTIPDGEHRLHHHPSATRPDAQDELEKPDIVSPTHSLFLAFTMILFSEIGDKTFLVACLMAMRHDRLLVFSAAFSALVTMTVLSAVLGHAVPTLIPKWLTNFLAAGLFLVFGIKMLLEARNISPDEGVSEEMKEVEQELEEKEQEELRRNRRRSSVSPYVLESGRGGIRKGRGDGRLPSPPDSPLSEASSRSSSPSRQSALKNAIQGINNLFSLLLSPAWVQTFVMTFLGEWGDRSQIATIAMAAGSDYWWVTAGALGGHAICTGVAVIGGKAIAGKVSLRTVTMGGAVAF